VDADNGLQCRLPAHAGDVHRNERGPFTRVAAPGQTTFSRVEQLVAAATRRTSSELGTSSETVDHNRHVHRARQNEKRKAARAAAAAEVVGV
jgi:hypothetical protein